MIGVSPTLSVVKADGIRVLRFSLFVAASLHLHIISMFTFLAVNMKQFAYHQLKKKMLYLFHCNSLPAVEILISATSTICTWGWSHLSKTLFLDTVFWTILNKRNCTSKACTFRFLLQRVLREESMKFLKDRRLLTGPIAQHIWLIDTVPEDLSFGQSFRCSWKKSRCNLLIEEMPFFRCRRRKIAGYTSWSIHSR